MALHILVDRLNVVGGQVVPPNTTTPPTQYCLESSGSAAYMETHS